MQNVFHGIHESQLFKATRTTGARFKEIQARNTFQGIPKRARLEATGQTYSNAKRVPENPRRVQVSPELDIELITLMSPDESS